MVQIRACDRTSATQCVLGRHRRVWTGDQTHPPTLDTRFHPSRCPRETQPCALPSRKWNGTGTRSGKPPTPPSTGTAPPVRDGRRRAGRGPTRHPAEGSHRTIASRTTSGSARVTRQRAPRLAAQGRHPQERSPKKGPSGRTRQQRRSASDYKPWRWARQSQGRRTRRPANGERQLPSPFRKTPAASPETDLLRLETVGWGGW